MGIGVAEHRPPTAPDASRNGTKKRNGFALSDVVTRVLSHSYDARDAYFERQPAAHVDENHATGPLWTWKTMGR